MNRLIGAFSFLSFWMFMVIQDMSGMIPQSLQRCKLTTGRPLRSSPSHRRCQSTVDPGCHSEDCQGSQQSHVASPSCGQLHERESGNEIVVTEYLKYIRIDALSMEVQGVHGVLGKSFWCWGCDIIWGRRGLPYIIFYIFFTKFSNFNPPFFHPYVHLW